MNQPPRIRWSLIGAKRSEVQSYMEGLTRDKVVLKNKLNATQLKLTDQQSANDKLADEIKETHDRLVKVQNEFAALDKEKSELADRNQWLLVQIERPAEDIQRLSSQLERLQQSQTELENLNRELREQNENLLQRVDLPSINTEDLVDQISHLEYVKADLEALTANLQAQNEEMQVQLSQRTDTDPSLAEKLLGLENTRAELEELNQSLHSQVQTLQDQSAFHSEETTQLSSHVTELETLNAELKRQNDVLLQNAAVMTAEVQRLNDQLTQVEVAKRTAIIELETVKVELQKHKEESHLPNEELASLSKKLIDLEGERHELHFQNQNLEAQVTRLEQETLNLKLMAPDQGTNQETERQFQEMRHHMKILLQDAERSTSERESMESEIARLRTKIEDQELEMNRVRRYASQEETSQHGLRDAQKAMDDLKAAAVREKEMIIDAANRHADDIIGRAQRRINEENWELRHAQVERQRFIDGFRQLLEQHLNSVDKLKVGDTLTLEESGTSDQEAHWREGATGNELSGPFPPRHSGGFDKMRGA